MTSCPYTHTQTHTSIHTPLQTRARSDEEQDRRLKGKRGRRGRGWQCTISTTVVQPVTRSVLWRVLIKSPNQCRIINQRKKKPQLQPKLVSTSCLPTKCIQKKPEDFQIKSMTLTLVWNIRFFWHACYDYISYMYTQGSRGNGATVMQSECVRVSIARRERQGNGEGKKTQEKQKTGPLVIHVIVNNFRVSSASKQIQMVYILNSLTMFYPLAIQQQIPTLWKVNEALTWSERFWEETPLCTRLMRIFCTQQFWGLFEGSRELQTFSGCWFVCIPAINSK